MWACADSHIPIRKSRTPVPLARAPRPLLTDISPRPAVFMPIEQHLVGIIALFVTARDCHAARDGILGFLRTLSLVGPLRSHVRSKRGVLEALTLRFCTDLGVGVALALAFFFGGGVAICSEFSLSSLSEIFMAVEFLAGSLRFLVEVRGRIGSESSSAIDASALTEVSIAAGDEAGAAERGEEAGAGVVVASGVFSVPAMMVMVR